MAPRQPDHEPEPEPEAGILELTLQAAAVLIAYAVYTELAVTQPLLAQMQAQTQQMLEQTQMLQTQAQTVLAPMRDMPVGEPGTTTSSSSWLTDMDPLAPQMQNILEQQEQQLQTVQAIATTVEIEIPRLARAIDGLEKEIDILLGNQLK